MIELTREDYDRVVRRAVAFFMDADDDAVNMDAIIREGLGLQEHEVEDVYRVAEHCFGVIFNSHVRDVIQTPDQIVAYLEKTLGTCT